VDDDAIFVDAIRHGDDDRRIVMQKTDMTEQPVAQDRADSGPRVVTSIGHPPNSDPRGRPSLRDRFVLLETS
jgi:hypothetical protein